MADEEAHANEVFRHSTMNRIASADDLDHYIKVTNPSAWVVVLAALLLVVGVAVWAVVAIVPVTVSTTGVLVQGAEAGEQVVVCWVDKSTAEKIDKTGAQAIVDEVEAKSVQVDDAPMSASEVVSFLSSDFYKESLNLSDWNYLVTIVPGADPRHSDYTIKTPAGQAHLVPVSIIVAETHPINIVMGSR